MKKVLFIAALVVSVISTHAQEKHPMEKFKLLAGNWEGRATQSMRDMNYELNQREEVQYELDGKLLMIRGEGRLIDTDSVAFQAFGILSWNKQAKEYEFRAYTGDRYVKASSTIKDNVFTWWFDVPNGTVRYTTTFDKNRWIEDGEFSSDGNNWYPFFHMELQRTK